MNIGDLIRGILPVQGKIETELKIDIKQGWLIIAIKLPTEAKP